MHINVARIHPRHDSGTVGDTPGAAALASGPNATFMETTEAPDLSAQRCVVCLVRVGQCAGEGLRGECLITVGVGERRPLTRYSRAHARFVPRVWPSSSAEWRAPRHPLGPNNPVFWLILFMGYRVRRWQATVFGGGKLHYGVAGVHCFDVTVSGRTGGFREFFGD